MMKTAILSAALLAFGAAAQEPSPAQQNRAWAKCRACHSTGAGESRNEGPTLHGVMGLKAGTVADFKNYSAAMKASGVVWSDETLDKFLAKPQTFMPGNTMPFPGMPRAEERAAVIIYLNNNTK